MNQKEFIRGFFILSKLSSYQVGMAGESYVKYFFFRCGISVFWGGRNCPRVDFVILDQDCKKHRLIQVKTSTSGIQIEKKPGSDYYSFEVGNNSIEFVRDELWYAFCSMVDNEVKIFFIHSRDVYELLKGSTDKRKFFWFLVDGSEDYRDEIGLNRMLE